MTFSGGLFLLIFALVRGNAEGWGSPLIVSFLVGAVVLLVRLRRRRAPPGAPDVRPHAVPQAGLRRARRIAAFALSASMFSMFLYLTLYLQNALGLLAAARPALRFLPLTLLSFFVAPIAGRLSARRADPRAHRAAAWLLVGIALLLMRGLRRRLGVDRAAAPASSSPASASALVNPPLASTAVGVVPPQRAGMGSGINSTFRQVGIATGTAGLGALFQHLLASDATRRAGARARPRSSRQGRARRCPGRRPRRPT